MNLSELSSLDFNNAGSWPASIKAGAAIILGAVILGAGYYFDTQEQLDTLAKAQKEEIELKDTFERKQSKSVNLEAYQAQLEEMRESFGAMLRQLPDKTEVAELLVDVSQTGLASGLEFELFEPQAEEPKEFYAELPIKLRVIGTYHEFGTFVSGLAALPRIVTLHDIEIKRAAKEGAEGETMAMDATARTYRYLDEESAPESEGKGKAPEGKRAKSRKK